MIIVIDGIDGSGKRVQSARLIKHIKEKGKNVTFKRVPTRHLDGNSLFSGLIFLKDLFHAKKLMSLAKKDRNENFLIIERYILSVAYAPLSKLLYRLIRFIFQSPDIYIVLDVPAKTALKRIKNRKKLQSHETIPKLDRIRKIYLSLSKIEEKKSRLYIVNADKSKNEVKNCIVNILES